MENNQRIEEMRKRLQQALNVRQLSISDDSHLHAGHAGAKTGKGHFTVTITADEFTEQPRIACHRLVYAALGDMMQTDIHALAIMINDC